MDESLRAVVLSQFDATKAAEAAWAVLVLAACGDVRGAASRFTRCNTWHSTSRLAVGFVLISRSVLPPVSGARSRPS
jgi:hypothetical protein